MKENHVIVVGAGAMGSEHVRAYKQLPGVRVISVVDPIIEKAERLAKQYDIAEYYDDIDKALHPEVQGVSICTPDSLHVEPVVKAARAGKHILLEKPIATRLTDAQTILSAVQAAGVKLLMGYTLRFEGSYVAGHQLVSEGGLGNIHTLVAKRFNGANEASRVAYRDSVITFLAVHDIDQLLWFSASPVERVFAEADAFRFPKKENEDTALITLRFSNGVIGALHVNWTLSDSVPYRAKSELEIIGDKGVAKLEGLDNGLWYSSDARGHAWPLGFDRPCGLALIEELKHFIQCIRGEAEPKVTGEEAYEVLRVAVAAKKSAIEHIPVLLEDVE